MPRIKGEMDLHVIAIDPGTEKCGIAVLSTDAVVAERMVVERADAIATLERLAAAYRPAVLVLGDRTGSKSFRSELEKAGICRLVESVHAVDEHMSSLEARERYFREHPPRGIRRFVPRTMQIPPVLFDDYVAVVLAERFLKTKGFGA